MFKIFNFARILFYCVAISGQVIQSIFHFSLSLFVIKFLTVTEFGLYAFIFIITFLVMGLGNALINTPLSVYLTQEINPREKTNLLQMFAKVNLYLSIVAGICVGGFFAVWQGKLLLSLNAAILVAVFLWRHFSRGINYARRTPHAATRSDFAYSGLGFFLISSIIWYDVSIISLEMILCILTISCLFSLLFSNVNFLSLRFFNLQFRYSIFGNLNQYRAVWEENSRWSLMGIITTELSANAHSYIISILAGPQAFAPIAAAVVLYRPLIVVINSMMSLERPLLVKQFLGDDLTGARHTLLIFSNVLLGCWVTLILSIWIMWPWVFEHLFMGKYELEAIRMAVLFLGAIYFIMIWRKRPSLILQAKNKFKPLALSTLITAPVSIITVVLLVIWYNSILSLGGILISETLLFIILFYIQRKTP